MAEDQPGGPDLALGISLADLVDGGKLVGHVGDEQVLLVRRGTSVFAVGADCTHYNGPLVDGLVVGETVRCPWHHACFDLRTGEALRAPALNPIPTWPVEQRGGKIFVGAKPTTAGEASCARSGRRGAGPNRDRRRRRRRFCRRRNAAARGFDGELIMLSGDDAPPSIGRTSPRTTSPATRRRNGFRFGRRSSTAKSISTSVLESGRRASTRGCESWPSSTGAASPTTRCCSRPGPSRCGCPSRAPTNCTCIRCDRLLTVAPSSRAPGRRGARSCSARASSGSRSPPRFARAKSKSTWSPRTNARWSAFSGPESATSFARFTRSTASSFTSGTPLSRLTQAASRSNGGVLSADFVVAGVGVRPAVLKLAEQAGLAMDRGVVVDAYLETSAPGSSPRATSRAGRILTPARRIRVEHWVVAERQGQIAARNMLGREKCAAVPFFWSQHYDVSINYVGHAERWDELAIEGDVAGKDCLVRFKREGRTLAVASIFRDVASLQAESEMEGTAARQHG